MPTTVPDAQDASSPFLMPPQPTGRRLVRFASDVPAVDARRILNEAAAPISRADMVGSVATAGASDSEGATRFFARSRIAVIGGGYDTSARIADVLQTRDGVAETRSEFWMFAIGGPPWQDGAAMTWGIDATGVSVSGFDGAGIRLAVLDTGLDVRHPAFVGRAIVSKSFTGEPIDDVKGHGTHCAGTAAGHRGSSGNLPGYGVAPGTELYIGKVLNNGGAGMEGDIIEGIEWALDNRCTVVSMSLGRAVAADEPFDPVYETIARAALDEGALIVAAAGNESARAYRHIAPVGAPANSPSVMAVAAIGADAGIAPFSCGGVGTGQVDIAGPGMGVFSTFPRPEMYKSLSGTSMACPHVAGIAALWAQSDPGLRGQALWDALVGAAVPVGGLPRRDVGAGLAKAP